MEPAWLVEARRWGGQKEVPGPQSNDWIMSLWQPIPWIWSTVTRRDDTLLPWCGAFVRLCLVNAGLKPPKQWYRARGYLDYGLRLGAPVVGAIGIVKSAKGQWHVGIVIGKDHAGNIIMWGGNQDNQVKASAFKPSAFQSYRWPGADLAAIPLAGTLPIVSAALSQSEI